MGVWCFLISILGLKFVIIVIKVEFFVGGFICFFRKCFFEDGGNLV